MQLAMQVVNAFTEQAFGGNPAAVIVTETWLSESLMQQIAAQNNLSETAFLVADNAGTHHIRWFSPITEIDFCGHATLASAYVLFERQTGITQLAFFAQAVGHFTVERDESGLIKMDFPNREPELITEIPHALISGLSIKPREVYRNNQAYFAIYDTEEDVRELTYTSSSLKQLAPWDVVVSSTSQRKQYDFVSRYFWPANGGDEDPVTGSIHAGLAPFWQKRLGKSFLIGFQASKRGGVLHCNVTANRVQVAGFAIQYLDGVIVIG
ncbi:Phenazine biosynthesis protein PhzF like [Pseudoalteromonas luteoviolacea B = ATCC 29581]|nr:Phenazine biosynthesis protein PhzF like [Pseudoalteromonas luteoviolacea B = ATCC 29581]